ncbi:MAG TPA: alpha/beta hydrolase-fold protein [Candidatus Angelobacter sp.]|nr:alpha/beta hydrolase-fold protein [Candidatus Angelobacter sp.]
MRLRAVSTFLVVCLASIVSIAQNLAPPAPERFTVHSNVLNEDRAILVRMPAAAQGKKDRYPVLYLADGDGHINEVGAIIDFLAAQGRCAPVMIVGIPNTDRTRDLTPTKVSLKGPDGSTQNAPATGGGDEFLEFIQTELFPEIEKRYQPQPYRIFAGHSLGGLLAIHALIAHPDMFNAYIAVSPSLQWDDQHTLHQAQQFFARQKEFNKTLFFSLGNEGATPNPMGDGFNQLQKLFATTKPKGFIVRSARYPDEDHGSTTFLAHYAGLRTVFDGWLMPRDPKDGSFVGGLKGVEKHYQELSERFGFPVSAEQAINLVGYSLLAQKKLDESIAAFKRNVELYPGSANVYDSLADGLEAAGMADLAHQNVQKAVTVGTETGDPLLPQFKQHLDRLTAAATTAKQDTHGK